MGIPSGWELVLLLAVLVLLFGATKLPTAARAIGQSMRIFKAETKGMRSEEESTKQPSPPPSPSLPPSGQSGTGSHETRVEEPHRRNDTVR
jgi:sec-independent protein translocase protein TatA